MAAPHFLPDPATPLSLLPVLLVASLHSLQTLLPLRIRQVVTGTHIIYLDALVEMAAAATQAKEQATNNSFSDEHCQVSL